MIETFFKITLSDTNYLSDSIEIKVKNLLFSFTIVFLLTFFAVLVLMLPLDWVITKVLHFESIRELISKSSKNINSYPVCLIVFIVPFFEELIFRIALKINKFNVSIFLGVLTYIVFGGKITPTLISTNNISLLLISVMTVNISFLYLPNKCYLFLKLNQRFIIYFSIFCFGLVHIFNISVLHWQLILFYPFFVLPQIIMGYFITNLRLKYGFIWGFALHLLINSFSVLIH